VVKERAPHIEKHLGSLLMPDLTEDRIKAYMATRKLEKASNRTINMELSVLARAVGSKFQILWPKLKHLEENHDVGRALEPAEEMAILDMAAKNRSRLIYPFLYTLAWTGMRSDEAVHSDGRRSILKLRKLSWADQRPRQGREGGFP
jgi:hypothetical protein